MRRRRSAGTDRRGMQASRVISPRLG